MGDDDSPATRRVTTVGVGSNPASSIRAMSSAEIVASDDEEFDRPTGRSFDVSNREPAGESNDEDVRRRTVARRMVDESVPVLVLELERRMSFDGDGSPLSLVGSPALVSFRRLAWFRASPEPTRPTVEARWSAVAPAVVVVPGGAGSAPRASAGATGRSSIRALVRRRAGRGPRTDRRRVPRAPIAAPSRRHEGVSNATRGEEVRGASVDPGDTGSTRVSSFVVRPVASSSDAVRRNSAPDWPTRRGDVDAPTASTEPTDGPGESVDCMDVAAVARRSDGPNVERRTSPSGCSKFEEVVVVGESMVGSGSTMPRCSIRSRNERAASAPAPVTDVELVPTTGVVRLGVVRLGVVRLGVVRLDGSLLVVRRTVPDERVEFGAPSNDVDDVAPT